MGECKGVFYPSLRGTKQSQISRVAMQGLRYSLGLLRTSQWRNV